MGHDRIAVSGQEVGIDVGIASLLQRQVACRKKYNTNRRKAVLALQRHYEHITNRRRDLLNKLVSTLIQRYDRLALEDPRITNTVRHHHLAKSILDIVEII